MWLRPGLCGIAAGPRGHMRIGSERSRERRSRSEARARSTRLGPSSAASARSRRACAIAGRTTVRDRRAHLSPRSPGASQSAIARAHHGPQNGGGCRRAGAPGEAANPGNAPARPVDSLGGQRSENKPRTGNSAFGRRNSAQSEALASSWRCQRQAQRRRAPGCARATRRGVSRSAATIRTLATSG